MGRLRFHHYGWGLLGYNLAVILGGAFVRATLSGDGCGAHWPTCNGELIPRSGRLATYIEFAHRASSGLLLPLTLALVVWAFRAFPKGHPARRGAGLVLAATLVEALIGAGLVLFRLVAHDRSVYRAVVMPTHLAATFFLLMALALTAWWGSGGPSFSLRPRRPLAWALLGAMGATLLLGVSGAITALGDTLFPGVTAEEALREASTPQAHFLPALRIYHPLIAISVGVYLALVAGLCMRLRPEPTVQRFARAAVLIFALQMAVGLVNRLLLAPVWLQLIHLLFADLFWVALVLLTAAVLAEERRAEPAAAGPPGERLDAGRRSRDGELAPAAFDAGATPASCARATWRDYLALTKPRVVSLLLFTALAAMFVAAGERGGTPGWELCLAVAAGLYMACGAANALNMALERDLDERMGRTANRPTVRQAVSPRAAIRFAGALTVGSFALLWAAANLLTALLALAGLAFYVGVYTLLLKRRTWANIVIGGAAGAFPPLVGWAAVTGGLSPLAWCLFWIIFLWTPVHFWALAIVLKDDYARAGVPMLPVVYGERATVIQIVYYTALTVAVSTMPLLLQGRGAVEALGWFYLVTALLLDGLLVALALQLYCRPDRERARSLFRYSMVYLALLFLAMALDRT